MDKIEVEKRALQNFVDQLIVDFDYALDTLDFYNGENPVITKRWLELSKPMSNDQVRRKKFAQIAVESILHSLLYKLGTTSYLRISIKGEDGNFYDLDKVTEGESYGDLLDWLREKSKYGCITMDMLDLDDAQS